MPRNPSATFEPCSAPAPATQKVYRADWDRYLRFCQDLRLAVPGVAGQVALYLTSRRQDGASLAVQSRALAAIAWHFGQAGLPNPRRDPAVVLVYGAARRGLTVAATDIEAALPAHWRALLAGLPQDASLRHLRDRALLALGRAANLRRAPLLALDLADVAFTPAGMCLQVAGRSVHVARSAVVASCPVRALQAWLDAAELQGGALFRTVAPDGRSVLASRLTTRQLSNISARSQRRAGRSGRVALTSRAALHSRQAPTSGHAGLLAMLGRYIREQQLFAATQEPSDVPTP